MHRFLAWVGGAFFAAVAANIILLTMFGVGVQVRLEPGQNNSRFGAWALNSLVTRERITSTSQLASNAICAAPVSGTDEKGKWWGIRGTKYRMSDNRPLPNARLCADGKYAEWERIVDY